MSSVVYAYTPFLQFAIIISQRPYSLRGQLGNENSGTDIGWCSSQNFANRFFFLLPILDLELWARVLVCSPNFQYDQFLIHFRFFFFTFISLSERITFAFQWLTFSSCSLKIAQISKSKEKKKKFELIQIQSQSAQFSFSTI